MMAELLVKTMFWFAISLAVFCICGYYVVNRSLIQLIIKFDKLLKEIETDVNSVKNEIETKNLKKEEIQDHIYILNKEKEMINHELSIFDFDKMLLSAAISLLVNFFGSKKLDKEKLINFVVSTVESSQDEICKINEVLYLAKSKLA